MTITVEITPAGDLSLTLDDHRHVLSMRDAVRLADALNALLDDPTDEERTPCRR
jgi:hypothetical protein